MRHKRNATMAAPDHVITLSDEKRDPEFHPEQDHTASDAAPSNDMAPDHTSTASEDSDQHDDPNRKSLLDIPPELRNHIYQYMINDGPPAHLGRHNKWRTIYTIAIKSPMLYVNKQVSDEFRSLALATSPVIETRVHNFNFRHAASFLDKLSDVDAAKLTSDGVGAPERVFRINLTVGDEKFRGPPNSMFIGLRRWLQRMQDNAKPGARIDFQYECKLKPLESRLRGLVVRVHSLGFSLGPLANETQEEWRKMKAVLWEPSW